MKKSLLIIGSLILFMKLFAQENIERITKQKETSINTSSLLAGIETSTTAYINTTTKDSSGTMPYVSIYVNYYNKNHLGVSAKTYVLPGGSNSGFYLTSTSAYYANYDGKLIPTLSYTRHIQHTNPSVLYSPIQNEILAQLRIISKYIEPILGIDWGFGNDKENNNENVYDINAFAGISHDFILHPGGKENMLAIVPTLRLNAGTNQYYSFLQTAKYISRNRSVNYLLHGNNSGRNRGGNMNDEIITETVINETNKFSLSNIETNLYLVFFTGRFSIEPSGSLYYPLRDEDKKIYGYWQLNMNFTLN